MDTFDRNFQYDVAHISLANAADLMLIAPATANVIAKLAHGQADDMLTTVTLAATCPKLVAPAMNTHMLENPITQDNLKTLQHYGFTVIPSGSGMLACGDVGSGRLPEEGVLVDYVLRELACEKGSARQKGRCVGRCNAGIHGPGALPDKPFHRQDGVCRGACLYAARRRGHASCFDRLHAAACSVCQDCAVHNSSRPL